MSNLSNPLGTYGESTAYTERGAIREVSISPFPQVPKATWRTWDYSGSGDLMGYTYYDDNGKVLAQQIYTWSGGKITKEVWN